VASFVARRAADRHPGAYGAGLAFERQRAFVLANALRLGAVLVATAISVVGIWLWFPVGPGARGFVSGVFVTSVVGALSHWVSIASGASQASMGQVGEEWTATELRRLRRRGWRILNHVMFRTWDVDHIAVGPHGVFVLETKWRSGRIRLDDTDGLDGWLAAAVARLHDDERDVARLLGWGSRTDAPIESVLVVWGQEIHQETDRPITASGGVQVVAGRNLRRYLGQPRHAALSPSEVDSLYGRLLEQARWRDDTDPLRPTLHQTANRWLLAFGVAIAGSIVSLAAATLLLAWYFVAAGLLVAAGLAVARRPRWRALGVAWTVGTLVVTGLILVAVVAHLLHS